jgi:hypothetical protein
MGRARDAWFAVKQNQILEHWCFASSDSHDADDFLNAHYTVEMANILRRQLREVGRREIAVCAECGKIVQDNALLNTMGALRRVDMAVDPVAKSLVNGFAVVRERWHEQVPSSSTDQALLVDRGTNPLHDGQATGASDTSCTPVLGYPLDVIAPAMAALSDFEEMVISLVHPLVQVYTIPTTGELAYVGHICNFKQHVSQLLSSLPVPPANMPFVLVWPRRAPGQTDSKPRAPHRVHVPRLRAAFEWLKQNNPYYRHVVWDTASAAEWEVEDPALPCRSQELPTNVQLSSAAFGVWMSAAAASESSGDGGFKMGRAFWNALHKHDPAAERWHVFRRILAERLAKRAFRAASSASLRDILIVGLDLGAVNVPDGVADEVDAFDLSALPDSEWPPDITVLVSELVAIKQNIGDVDGVVDCGTTADMPADGDIKERVDAVEELAAVLRERQDLLGFDGESAAEPPAPGSGVDEKQRSAGRHAPRVDAPTVDDRPGQAIAEE